MEASFIQQLGHFSRKIISNSFFNKYVHTAVSLKEGPLIFFQILQKGREKTAGKSPLDLSTGGD